MKRLMMMVFSLFLMIPAVVYADNYPTQVDKKTVMADGEIRKIDKDAGKVTIKHGPIPSLDMPPMTMVFRVKEAAMLEHIKEGDKIKFSAEKISGAYTVTKVLVPSEGEGSGSSAREVKK